MFDLCSSDTIFEEKYREIYEKREKVYRVAAPYKNVTYNTTTQLTHVCVYWCVKIVRAACAINTHTVGCACIESKTIHHETYIAAISYQGYCFSVSVWQICPMETSIFWPRMFISLTNCTEILFAHNFFG